METLRAVWTELGPWIPSGVVLLILALVVLYSKRAFSQANQGGFQHQVLMALLPILGAPVLVLTLPIDGASRGQLLSLLGILLSAAIALSSTTFVGNAMAGLLLRGIGNFKPGDFLAVDEEFGRVVSRGLFHTEVQTRTRDLVTLPNLYLVTKPVRVVRSSGTFVGAEVSLGYDVPRSDVEARLLGAAEQAGLEEAYVSVLALGDYSVLYKVSGLLRDTLKLITARSLLRKCMLDALHEARIEIVSPRVQLTRTATGAAPILPPVAAAEPPPVAEPRPETVIFDKAEEAATIERLKELYDEVGEELAEAKGPAREQLLARQSRLAEAIDRRKTESARDD